MQTFTESRIAAQEREINNLLTNKLIGKLSNSRRDKLLSKKQIATAKRFNDHMINSGFQITTRKFYLQALRNFLCFIKKDDPKKIRKRDIEKFLISVKHLNQTSIYSIQLFLRCFFRWLYNSKDKDVPAIVAWIKPKKSRNLKLPEEILTLEDIKKMIQVMDSLRDKAVIFCLYESACRESEFLSLKLKHVTLDRYGAVLVVNGKTGMRRIRLINSVPALIRWLNAHPQAKNPEAPLWINLRAYKDRPFGVSGLKRLLIVAKQRAEIKKNVYPHLLRHSRLTELAKNLTEQELKMFAGWKQASTMAQIYVHLSGKDIDDKLLSIAGRKDLVEAEEDKKRKEALRPKICQRCEKVNSAEARFCEFCSMPFDVKTVMEISETDKRIIDELKRRIPGFEDLTKEIVSEMVAKGEIPASR